MAWLNGASLTMPQDAGEDRSGGTRMQAPNVQRTLVPGGIAVSLVADATLKIGGVPYILPGGVYTQCDDGGVTLLLPNHYYISYVTAAAPTVLRSCRQENWAATYTATDVYGLLWHTDHYDIYLPVLVTRGCTNANPTPTMLSPKTNAVNFPMPSGTLLANADLRNLRGLAYDGTTGTLILSIGVGLNAFSGAVSAADDRIFYCGSDGILHVAAGMCGSGVAGYLGVAASATAAVWTAAGWTASGLFNPDLNAPDGTAMLCRAGKLYTLQVGTFGIVIKVGRGEQFDIAIGLLRSFDLTTHTTTTLAALVYPTATRSNTIQNYVTVASNHLALALDSSGNFYTTYIPGAFDHTFPPSSWPIPSGIVRIPSPSGIPVVNMVTSDPSFGANPAGAPVAAWAGGIGVDQRLAANYADGMGRTVAAVGTGDRVITNDAAAITILDTDAHDNLVFAAAQVDVGNNTPRWSAIRAIDAAAGTLSTIAGNFSDRDVTTGLANYTGVPAYPGDTAVGHDGNASNSLAATWSGVLDNIGTASGAAPVGPYGISNFINIIALDRAANILYYIDQGLASIRSIKLGDGNLLCTLTGGPLPYVAGDITTGTALGPAQGMRGFPAHLAIDEATGNLYYTMASSVSGVIVFDLYRAKFY